MHARYTFDLKSEKRLRGMPGKLLIARGQTETPVHVLLKALAFLLFCRERLQMELNLHTDSIPYVPDLVQLDYTMRPVLWVECGECTLEKLDRLSVKAPEAEIWSVKRSEAEAVELLAAMEKEELRRNRYGIVGVDAGMLEEMLGSLGHRNEFYWVTGRLDPGVVQFDFNGLWFDAPLMVLRR